jgi:beta-galactosidase
MDRKYVYDLRSSGKSVKKPGVFFKGNFVLTRAEGNTGADTFIDFSNYTKGIIWINGHNLGRYWNIGPQKRLYCPASWLREGLNEIMLFDQHETATKWVNGFKTLE